MRLRLLIACLFLAPGLALAQANRAQLAELDRMREQGKFREVMASLEALHQKNPNDGEVLWRISRTRVDLGESMAAGKAQQAAYRKSMEEALSAVKAAPKSAEAYLAVAIASGRVALSSPTKRKIELSRQVKENVDRAIALDPNNGVAYHVRGRWNYEVASLGFMEKAVVKMVYGGLPNASFEQAAADYQRANRIHDRVINRLELGKTYLKLGDKNKAKAELQRAVALPNEDPDDPAHKQEARSIMNRMG